MLGTNRYACTDSESDLAKEGGNTDGKAGTKQKNKNTASPWEGGIFYDNSCRKN